MGVAKCAVNVLINTHPMYFYLVLSKDIRDSMNTILSRLNAVFAFSLTVLAVLTLLCFLSTAFSDRLAPTSVETHDGVAVKLARDFSGEQKDLGFVKFDILANFSHLFDWNTKQLFVLLTALYQTEWHEVNQVVLWDKIIQRGDSPLLDLRGLKCKYNFIDEGKGLKGNNVKLQLSWNVIPLAGRLPLVRAGVHHMEFPSSYS